ncbi:MAG TPA: FG-GAP-like repeat-containing protein [Tepidisphaeraceae bacterium]|nr:FG-GAP-like repeat-containing protein [Tepidisphaeraceae bacterium]
MTGLMARRLRVSCCERLEGRFLLAGLPSLALEAPRNVVTERLPYQVLPMDLDQDGDLDVAVASFLVEGRLELFENVGNGTLVKRTEMPLADSTPLELGDFNNDGRVDLAQVREVVPVVSGELRTYLQNGAFSFDVQATALPFPARRLCVGDLDGVGGLDLVIAETRGSPVVHAYYGNGAGAFTQGGEYWTEAFARDVDGDGDLDEQEDFKVPDVMLADMNGDGRQDLVAVNSMTRRISRPPLPPQAGSASNLVVLFNQGAGALGEYQVIVDPATAPVVVSIGTNLAVGDLDGDGDRDIAVQSANEVLTVANAGNGTFLTPRRHATGAPVGELVNGTKMVDVEGDGDLDVAVYLRGPLAGNPNDSPTDRWTLLRNDGAGNLSAAEHYPTGADVMDLEFADLDGVFGPEALTVAADDDRLSVHYNQAGQYRSPRVIPVNSPEAVSNGTTVTDIAAGDVDNDGWADLVVLGNHSQLVGDGPDSLILLNGSATGGLATPTFIDLAEGPMRLIAERIAGSAASDIAIAYLGDSLLAKPEGVSLSLGSTGALPGAARFVALSGMPTDLAAADVDGDGTQDLAAIRIRREGITAGIAILTVADDGTLTYLGDLILGSDDVLAWDSRTPDVICAADVNRDGRKDLIAVARRFLGGSESIVSVILNHGELTFSLAGEFAVGSQAISDVVAEDVTGDGLPDVILTAEPSITDTDDGTLRVLPNLGGGILGEAAVYNVGKSPVRVAAAEVDGRPGVDLVVACDSSNEVTLLHNDGQGRFPTQERFLTAGGADALAVADLDGDGDLDVAVANDDDVLSTRFHHGMVSILANRRIGAAPTIGNLASGPVMQGYDFTLTAGQVTDVDGAVVEVRVYRDANGNGVFDDPGDTFLGMMTPGAGADWSWRGASSTLPVGENRFFARAFDGERWSEAATVTTAVASPRLMGTDGGNSYVIRLNDIGEYVQIDADLPAPAGDTPIIQIHRSVFSSLTIDAGAGQDILTLIGSGAERIKADNAEVRVGEATISLLGVERQVYDLAALTVNDPETIVLSEGGNKLLKLGSLEIGPDGTLNLADNDLIVSATPETRAAVLAAVTSAIKSARGTDGKWAGKGLSSSAAASRKYTGLAFMSNADAKTGSAILSNFGGQAVTANDILVKYTWNGDVNLDGKVDLADYFLVDSGFIKQTGGYRNGDLNLDGKVDLADYFLIDSAFIGQRGILKAQEVGPVQ